MIQTKIDGLAGVLTLGFLFGSIRNRELLDLKAKTGVRRGPWLTNFDHKDRSRSYSKPMNLMISENVLQLMPSATNEAATETISYAIGACALGQALVARSVSGVCAILMGADRDELEADLAAHFTDAKLVAHEADVDGDLAKLVRSWTHLPKDFLSLSICAARRSSAESGKSFARSMSAGW